MTRYACSNPGCPPRTPVPADGAPTCYTCGGAMAVVVGPGIRSTEAPLLSDVLAAERRERWAREAIDPARAQIPPGDWFMPLDLGVPYFDPASSIEVSIPEPTPEQRASRTLPGPTIFEPTRKLLLRRNLDGHAVLFHIVAPQFKRSGSCAELRLEEMVNVQQWGFLVDAVNVQQWAFLVDAHRHNRDLAIELSGVFTSSKARIDGMTNSATPDGSHHVKLIIKAILAPEAP